MIRLLRYLKVVISICSILSFSRAFAESVDLSEIYKCDDLFCPDNSSQPIPINEPLNQTVGLSVGSVGDTIKKVDRVIVSETKGIEASQIQQTSEPQLQVLESPQDKVLMSRNSSEKETDERAEAQASSVSNKNSEHQTNYNTSFPYASSTSQGPKVRNGYIYSNSSETPTQSPQSEAERNSNNNLTPHGTSPINPVALNQQLSSARRGLKEQPTDSRKRKSLTSMTAPSGSISSKNGTNTLQKQNEEASTLLGQLNEIAQGMGQSFFALIGNPKNTRLGQPIGSAKSNLDKSKRKEERTAPFDRDMLKKRYAEYYKRGLASKLELGSSNSSIFANICRHYDSYAQQNRIPGDRGPCPEE